MTSTGMRSRMNCSSNSAHSFAFLAAAGSVQAGSKAFAVRKCRSQVPGGAACRRFAASFHGSRLSVSRPAGVEHNTSPTRRYATTMLVDPWSVSPEAVDAVAAQLFAASLFPYLGFLYFLGRDEVKCPKLANFGFQFLLVFVFATIPAGIYAKVHYHDILANVDWLHGSAESLLTVTNLLIVLGFRNALAAPSDSSSSSGGDDSTSASPTEEKRLQLKSSAAAGVLAVLAGALPFATVGALHAEPWNALSFPTWVIHVSSLVEWLVAMGLVWQYASASGNARWKGLTWGMLPLHTSGICACTYHLFYNAPSLNVLVALQAGLTCFGNATMAGAAYRIWQNAKGAAGVVAEAEGERGEKAKGAEAGAGGLVGFEDLGQRFGADSNAGFFGKVAALSCAGSAAVKWGSLGLDAAFAPSLGLALGLVLVPTGLNMAKWAVRSRTGASDFGGFL